MSETENAIKFMVEAQQRAFSVILAEKDLMLNQQDLRIKELELSLESLNSLVKQQSEQIQELQKGQ